MADSSYRVSRNSLQESWFQPMGFRLRVLTNHPAIKTAAEASFRGFGPTEPATSADFTLHLFAHDVESSQLREPGYRAVGSLIYRTADHTSTLMVDRERGLAWGYFSPTVIAHPAFFRYHFLEFAFYVMLSSRGLIPIHASACVQKGRALLLRAPSGGGKTTLVYAAARRGFQALAEDVVWIDVTHHVWWGMPWWFHLPPDTRQFFPELATYAPILEINGTQRLEVELESLRPGSTAVSAQPGPVVLLRRLPGACSRLVPLEFAAARELWFQDWSGNETDFVDYHRYVDELLRHDTYRLDCGDDLDQSLDLLESLLA